MSVYDPLRILAPFFLRAKLLMQMICRSGVKWDKPIYNEEFDAWQKWLTALREVKGCKIPRSYIPRGEEYAHSELHILGDPSSKAYAAVAYLRTVPQNGEIHVSLIMSKTRVAPIKPTTIPRLELQAVLLSARLAATVGEELQIKIDESIFWSDLTTVLHWIRSEPQFKNVFVANRLGKVAEISRVNEWRWPPTEDNPADDATRATDRTMQANDRWFITATLLCNTPELWPVQKPLSPENIKEINQEESRKTFVGTSSVKRVEVSTIVKLLGWDGLLMSGKRLRYYVRLWVNRWRESKLEQGVKPGIWCDRWQAAPERADAREKTILAVRFWYREIQSACLPEDLHAIKNRKDLKRGSKLRGLKPYLDDEGLLRARGRVSRIDNRKFENTPIILDAAHYTTKLLIAHYHRQYDHVNNETVVDEMRQRFHVIDLRNRLRWLAKQCIVCRVQRAKPQNPPMADLPKSRVAYGLRPFAHCGIDYFGPVHVKVGRQRHKRWVVLFTCMTTRGVHVDWHFNPPEPPHMGGAWERLVRSVKTALNHALRDKSYSEEVLQTVLIEDEHMINSRPLTHVSIHPYDEEASTPNHFLFGSSSGYPNLERYEKTLINPRKQFEISQQLLGSFWPRYLREYLPTLLPRKKWHDAGDSSKIGDIVLLVDYQAPRNTWRKGKIVDIFPGPDGVNRVAKVILNNSYYVRLTHKLIRIFRDEGVES